jgi:DNA helicase-2/ATP-dependent DNA helicase PcrA
MASWPKASAAGNEQSNRQIRVDIGARMRSMWK